MLRVTVQNSGEATILHCTGRIVRGEETAILCNTVLSQQGKRVVILNLANVDAIDGSGLGLLVSLQDSGIYLKLMNPSKHVREVLELTNLASIFEICSYEDMAVATREDSAQEEIAARE